MELDGLCEELMLAFEYQGIQHYETSPFFHRKISLDQRIKDDLLKRELSERNGITLLAIPHSIAALDLPAFLQQECARVGIKSDKPFTWDENDIYGRNKAAFDQLKNLAERKGGVLLSKTLLTDNSPLKWKCRSGHMWEAAPGVIKRGHWCPQCGTEETRLKNTKDIDFFRGLAKDKGGVCLTSDRVKGDPNLTFKCAKGHEWNTHQYVVQQGHWCPQCSRSGKQSKYSIQDAKTLAAERGGLCLSDTCSGSMESLTWRCKKGHVFKGAIRYVRKSWCQRCAKEDVALEACSTLAASRGGKCLSTNYVDARTKMLWICNAGHTWESTWSNIKSGRWCPRCGRISQWEKRKSSDAGLVSP
jgi:hypothetical protein